jgi:putative methionine-R-sulfoxide reductase with GAF domain
VDSDDLAAFGDRDRALLESIAGALAKKLTQQG